MEMISCIIKQLFTIESLDMTLVSTIPILTSGGYHIISNDSLVNNCTPMEEKALIVVW